MPRSRAVQTAGPKRPLELFQREVPEPGAGEVRVRIEACGVCHSDYLTVEGHWPGISYPGDLVAVLGVGGLGHLGVQFAAKMGFETVAIARGKDKEALSRELGARHAIDRDSQDPAAELTRLGGAKLILATVTSGQAMTAVLGGLAVDGKLLIVGAPADPLEVPAGVLIGGRRSIAGWPSGTSIESEDTMKFAAVTGVRSRNEVFPLERAADAYARMMSGKARFRVVLTT